MNAYQQKQYEDFIERWRTGSEDGARGRFGAVSWHIVRYIKCKFENKCCKCGWCKVNTYSGRVPLEINHIDGNSRNNVEENLELICPNCHSLTSSYRSLNKGKGRKERKSLLVSC